ncbi:hypothetical protein SARC_17662 [Sphaeroforma arctica JP610]|uniref:DNA ligase ATP-dependent N-terminal domain-containing protein n=1 Tax=Sphaeroforma arctica JP610 TaxID=667725 RepID=A0A0L0F107_9EUKA|nr:hypothetical protein SARC_17662 [Sphaeroforma arctica JP610]KNC69818.1 hypothetical protein SARC_17662 [Sphaeroforma arctica JP610]|eukprot:XP_014143720.1 hypothetical protein SARC_17662 [Sphaeroforma arctica JP610]
MFTYIYSHLHPTTPPRSQLGPSYEGLELGIGEGLIKKLLAETTGQSQQAIRDSLQLLGDLGKVAETKKATQSVLFKPKALSVPNVYKSYVTLAKMSGDKVQRNKTRLLSISENGLFIVGSTGDKIKSMMVAGSSLEAKYVVRAMQGKLRIGLAEKIVLAALAQAYTMTPPVRDGGA